MLSSKNPSPVIEMDFSPIVIEKNQGGVMVMDTNIQLELKTLERTVFKNMNQVILYLRTVSELAIAYVGEPEVAELSYKKINNKKILVKLENECGYCIFQITKYDTSIYYLEFKSAYIKTNNYNKGEILAC